MKLKSEARKETLKIRNSMRLEEVNEKSDIIINKLLNTEEYKNAKTIMVYMDFKNEVKTGALIDNAFKSHKRVVIPYTHMEKVEVIPVEISSLNDLVFSKYGYLEPKKEATNNPFPVKDIDLIVVPGVAFDRSCNRVGFGKGYYDKLLIQRKDGCKAIAIAYEYQVYNRVEALEHDIKMDLLLTEENIYIKMEK